MTLHYMLEPSSSVCGKRCKRLEEIPTEVDVLKLEVLAGLTKCKPCLEWIAKPTNEKTSVYLGEEIR